MNAFKPTTSSIISRLSSSSSSQLSNQAALAGISHRYLSTTSRQLKWEGRHAEEHTARETDRKGVQHEAVKEGKEERAKNGSRAAGEGSGGAGEKAKEEFPEAPDVIGMQDERGGKITGGGKK